jgi:hypothetical protein
MTAMYARLLTVPALALLLTLPNWAGGAAQKEGEEADIHRLDLKGLKTGIPKGKVTAPTEITTAEQLAKEFPDEEWQTKIKNQVDFTKSKLLYFGWAGSGGDKLGFQTEKTDKGLVVTFLYQPGLTRDLRGHVVLFAIPKDATWKVTMGKPGK